MKQMAFFLSLLLLASCHKSAQKTPVHLPLVTIANAKQESVQLYKSYVGTVQPYIQVEVQAQVEGTLTGRYFTEGDEVEEGQLLFTIDSRPYEAQLEQAEAALAQSLVNLRYAEDVATRNAKLAELDYVSKLQYEEYISEVLAKKAEVEQHEADIEKAKINISYCNIYSPMDAVTGIVVYEVGNLIKNAQTTITTINQIKPVKVYFSIPQKDLPTVMKLQRQSPLPVQIFLNQNYAESFPGELNLINNQVDDKTGSILLRAICPNEKRMLWPGEFVDVHLYLYSFRFKSWV